jgi:hypothetical protein
MREKVRNGIDGIHVNAASPFAWGKSLSRLAGWSDEWDALVKGIGRPISYADCADVHCKLIGPTT